MDSTVDAVRQFNRFYTNRIGLLREHLNDSDFTLSEARVLFELASGSTMTAADLGRRLEMDKAHVSRILARFRARNLIDLHIDPEHRKRRLIDLLERGRRAFASLDEAAVRDVAALLRLLAATEESRLLAAMHEIESLLADRNPVAPPITLRDPRPGDLGWITHRQGLLYHREYGWDWTYEALVAEILAGFASGFDAAREAAWIAEQSGQIAGSIFLMQSEDATVGKLRLLYVEPTSRGHGLGARLVDACVSKARQLGYRQLSLWTNDVLVAARRIYESAGFQLVSSAPHRSFGKDLVGQTWVLEL